MDDRDGDEGPTAAEQAFDALRAEVAGMRRALQGLAESLKQLSPVDYTETLGAMAKRLEILGSTMAAIEQHPAIRTTPAQYNHAIAAAVTERRELAAMIGTMRGQWKQWEWLAWTGGAAFILGLLISPVFARVLPFGWDGRVAAFIMDADRWTAGSALMKAQSPDAWLVLMAAGRLTADNSAVLAACRETAAKTKKEQHCTVIVPAP